MPYFANFRKPIDSPILAPDPPPAGTPRRGRPPTPITPDALERVRAMREAGETFEYIRGVLADEFDLQIGLATLYEVWERDVEPRTKNGQFIQRMQKLIGLPTARWRRYLRDQRRLASSATSAAAGRREPTPKMNNSPYKQGASGDEPNVTPAGESESIIGRLTAEAT